MTVAYSTSGLTQPLVSIIVSTYQREKLLRETIGYSLAQDYRNRELLIVDQSLSHEPETARYLDSIAGQVRYFLLTHPNLPAARNFGIRQSKGELIVFFDDDMVIGPSLISRLVRLIQHRKSGAPADLFSVRVNPMKENIGHMPSS